MPLTRDQPRIAAERARQRAQQAAQARQAAQRARVQSEQQARIGEQRRRQQQAAAQAAAIARSKQSAAGQRDVEASRRAAFQDHAVKRGDTAESIAKQYGVKPKDISDQVQSLRPGQSLRIPGRNPLAERRAPSPGAAPIQQAAIVQPTMTMAENVLRLGQGATPMVLRVLSKFGYASSTPPALFPEGDPFGGNPPEQTDYLRGLDEVAAGIETSREFQLATGQDVPRADLSQYNELRQIPGGIHDQMQDTIANAMLDKQNFNRSMADVSLQVTAGWDAMMKGDPEYSKFLKDVPFTSAAFNQGTGLPMMEAMGQVQRDQLADMGYREVETGLWVPMGLEEPDYGMGGYSFPGYGGGGGYGGGEYEYLSRGGIQRRKQGGGASGGERQRIFPEGVSPAHWRI